MTNEARKARPQGGARTGRDRRRRIAAYAAGVAALAAAWPAWSAPLSITPTSVTLSQQNATELISLLNDGDQPARFQASISAWSETPDGHTQLAPTQDLIAFPLLLEIPPHETKRIRLGWQGPAAAAEKSYRLVIEELPSAVAPPGQVQIQVLTKVSIPVFFLPPGAAPTAKIGDAKIGGGVLEFAVENPGAAHFMLSHIEIAGEGAAGQTFKLDENGWYVLAGGSRVYKVALAAADCRETRSVRIAAVSNGPKADIDVAVDPSTCGSATKTQFIEANLGPNSPAH